MAKKYSTKINPLTLRPTVMEVDLDALTHNISVIKRQVGQARVMAVVKANAYGHGLIPCAKHFINSGADYLGVAFLEEGIILRQAGITAPILVFGGIFNSQIQHFLNFDLELTASSVSKLQAIEEVARSTKQKAKVHLKIDTGLGRIGIQYSNANLLFDQALKCKHCNIVGVFSHFATADEEDISFSKVQVARFLEAISFFRRNSLPTPICHLANSGALLQLPESYLDMVRIGVCAYGVVPDIKLRNRLDIKPALSLHSKVVYVKTVQPGTTISYGRTWEAVAPSRIVTIPVGYGDGYFRRLSNKGEVLIRGQRYPIVGRVCMDQIMINVKMDECYNGDDVVLVGRQGEEQITVEEIAELVDTRPHEVLTSVNLRVPRRYLKNGNTFTEEQVS